MRGVRGLPIPLCFAGWTSDTAILQQYGWQIAENRDIATDSWCMVIKHPDLHLVGHARPIHLRTMYENQVYGTPSRMDIQIAGEIVVRTSTPMDFIPVDATPQYSMEMKDHYLYDQPYFQPLQEGKDIFLKRASVQEIMQIALDKQEPEQAKIRARLKQEKERETWRRGGTTAAKLIMVP